MSFSDNYIQISEHRFSETISFLEQHVKRDQLILDLGHENPMSQRMQSLGFNVANTTSKNLDDNYSEVENEQYNVLTSFEIFEHLMAPYNILKASKAEFLVASVPLQLPFIKAYWNNQDPYDCHYHEFEPKQFDMLLDRTGWEIIDTKSWTNPVNKIGFRPILRRLFNRYYAVYCRKK